VHLERVEREERQHQHEPDHVHERDRDQDAEAAQLVITGGRRGHAIPLPPRPAPSAKTRALTAMSTTP
jgi:hypothetical protein